MDSYSIFASIYDTLMVDTPYEKWIDNIEEIWKRYNLKPNLVLDLACGTGTITTMLANKNYDMIGVDLSYDMLMEASTKMDKNILYLNQDMRSFELYGTVDSIICLCDSINYLLKDDDLEKVFRLVNNYLNPEGLFIFDMNSEYKFSHVLANNTFGGNYDNISYIWENFYDEITNINEYTTCFFIKDNKTKMYNKYEEVHHERAYSIEHVSAIIKRSGLELVGVFDEDLFSLPTETSERIYFICKESGKNLT